MRTRKLIDELNRSIPSLHYQTHEMDGWCDRLARQYGYNTLRGIVASGIASNPSPSLDPLYKAWAATVPIPSVQADIPFAYLQYLAHYLMQKERFGVAGQANIRTNPQSGRETTHAMKYIGLDG